MPGGEAAAAGVAATALAPLGAAAVRLLLLHKARQVSRQPCTACRLLLLMLFRHSSAIAASYFVCLHFVLVHWRAQVYHHGEAAVQGV